MWFQVRSVAIIAALSKMLNAVHSLGLIPHALAVSMASSKGEYVQ